MASGWPPEGPFAYYGTVRRDLVVPRAARRDRRPRARGRARRRVARGRRLARGRAGARRRLRALRGRAPGARSPSRAGATRSTRSPPRTTAGSCAPDGTAPASPLADVDSQAAAHAALRALARLSGDERWERLAAELRERLGALGPDAMAVEPDGTIVPGAGSQLGWLLWADALDGRRARGRRRAAVRARRAHARYGLRTLSSDSPVFGPALLPPRLGLAVRLLARLGRPARRRPRGRGRARPDGRARRARAARPRARALRGHARRRRCAADPARQPRPGVDRRRARGRCGDALGRPRRDGSAGAPSSATTHVRGPAVRPATVCGRRSAVGRDLEPAVGRALLPADLLAVERDRARPSRRAAACARCRAAAPAPSRCRPSSCSGRRPCDACTAFSAPVPSRMFEPAIGDGGRQLRDDLQRAAAHVRAHAELLVHDRPRRAVVAPRLHEHRAAGPAAVDVRAEVRRRQRSPASRPAARRARRRRRARRTSSRRWRRCSAAAAPAPRRP